VLTVDRVAGLALALFGGYVLWESRRLPLGSLSNPGPGYMPVVLALALVGFALLVAALGERATSIGALGWQESRRALAVLAACAFTALALERLGYRITMTLVLVFVVGVLERKGPVATAVFALGLALGTYLLFDTFLRVQLPRGPFGL
jgi:hypothetical protein